MAGEDGTVHFDFSTNAAEVVQQVVDACSELDSVLASTGDVGTLGGKYVEQVDEMVASAQRASSKIRDTFLEAFAGRVELPSLTFGGSFNQLITKARDAGEAAVKALSPEVRAGLSEDQVREALVRPIEAIIPELERAEAAVRAVYDRLAPAEQQAFGRALNLGQISTARNRAQNVVEEFLTKPVAELPRSSGTTTLYRAEGGVREDGTPQSSAAEASNRRVNGRFFFDNPESARTFSEGTSGAVIRAVTVLNETLEKFQAFERPDLGGTAYLTPAEVARSSTVLPGGRDALPEDPRLALLREAGLTPERVDQGPFNSQGAASVRPEPEPEPEPARSKPKVADPGYPSTAETDAQIAAELLAQQKQVEARKKADAAVNKELNAAYAENAARDSAAQKQILGELEAQQRQVEIAKRADAIVNRELNAAYAENAARDVAAQKQILSELEAQQKQKDAAFRADRLAAKQLTDAYAENARRDEKAAKAAAASAPPPTHGVGNAFLGGAFGHGFDTHATFDPKSSLSNLASTAGVLLRYGTEYQAIYGIEQAFKAAFVDANNFNAAQIELSAAMESTGVSALDLNKAIAEGNSLGVDNVTTTQIATQALEAYRDEITNNASANEVLQRSITGVGDAMLISGQDAKTAQTQLISATSGFGTGSRGIAQINDAVVNAQKNYGGNAADIYQAVSTSAAAAAQSGTTPEELANIAGLITSRTGDTGAVVSNAIDRLVSRGGNPTFVQALKDAGVSQTGDLQSQIIGLSKAYHGMSDEEKKTFELSLGGSKALKDLLPLLQDGQSLGESYARSLENVGAGAKLAAEKQATFAGQINEIKAIFTNLATNLGNAKIYLPIEILVAALKPALLALNQLVALYNQIGDIPGVGKAIQDLTALGAELLVAGFAFKKFKEARAAADAETAAAAAAKNTESAAQEKLNAADAGAAASTKALTDANVANTASLEARIAATLALIDAEKGQLDAGLVESGLVGGNFSGAAASSLASREETVAAEAGAAGLFGRTYAKLNKPVEISSAAISGRLVRAGEGFAGALSTAASGVTSLIGAINPVVLGLVAAPILIESALNGFRNLSKDGALNANQNLYGGNYNELVSNAGLFATQAQNNDSSSGGIFGHLYNAAADVIDKLPFVNANDLHTKAAIDRAKASHLTMIAAQLQHFQTEAGAVSGDTAVFNGSLTPDSIQTAVASMQAAGESSQDIANTIIAAQTPPDSGYVLQKYGGAALAGELFDKLSVGKGVTHSWIPGASGKAGKGGALLHPDDFQTYLQNQIQHLIGSGGAVSQSQIDALAQAAVSQIQAPFIDNTPESKKAFYDQQLKIATTAIEEGLAGQSAPTDQAGSAAAQAGVIAQVSGITQNKTAATGSALQGAQAGLDSINAEIAATAAEGFTPTANILEAKQAGENQVAAAANAHAVQLLQLAQAYSTNADDPVGQALDAIAVAQTTLAGDIAGSDKQLSDRIALVQAQKAAFQASVSQLVATSAIFGTTNGQSDPSKLIDQFNPLAVDAQNLVSDATNLTYVTEFGKDGKVTQAYANARKKQAADQHQYLADQIAAQQSQAALDVQIGDAVGADIQQYNAAIQRANTVDRTNLAARNADLQQAKQAAAQSYLDEADLLASQALANIKDPRNVLAIDRQTVTDDNSKIRAYRQAGYTRSTSTDLNNAIIQRTKDEQQLQDDQLARHNAQIEASARISNSVSQDRAALQTARNSLDALNKNDDGYYDALKQYQSAKYQLAEDALSHADDVRLLHLDLTNPLLTARDAVTKARQQLTYDETHKTGDLTKDRLALVQAQNSASKTAFDQEFQAQQTKYQLQQESAQQYLQYLENERNSLSKIKHKTYEQQQELNEVNQAILSLNNSLSGQFNLGDIALPTVYDVRRQIAAGSAATTYVDSATTTNNVTINGVDITQVIKYVNSILGPAATKTKAHNTGRKK